MAGKTRNEVLPGGVMRYGRAAMFKKRRLHKGLKQGVKTETPAKPTTKTVEVKGDKNGGTRVVPVQRQSRFLPYEEKPRALPSRKNQRPAKIRSSITPGTVLVLLSGPYRGRRVVFLNALPSGLLLVTGPFNVNGVPVRRVNQAYVIATSTKIDVSKVNTDKFTDAYFKRPESAKKGEFFEQNDEEKTVSEERKKDQKELDSALAPAVKAVPHMRQYLRSYFTLSKGQYPHAMNF